jgi:hypothetical protein
MCVGLGQRPRITAVGLDSNFSAEVGVAKPKALISPSVYPYKLLARPIAGGRARRKNTKPRHSWQGCFNKTAARHAAAQLPGLNLR